MIGRQIWMMKSLRGCAGAEKRILTLNGVKGQDDKYLLHLLILQGIRGQDDKGIFVPSIDRGLPCCNAAGRSAVRK